MNEKGVTLVPCLLGLTMAGGMLALLSLQLHTAVRRTGEAASQLRAVLMAQDGIEQGRRLLALRGSRRLLAGADGILEKTPPDRTPLPLEAAARLSLADLSLYRPAVDDGWPWTGDEPASQAPDGRVFWRFSNDPEEGGSEDTDGIVLLRSLAVVASRGGGRRPNHVALIEARLRRAAGLRLDSAIVAVGDLTLGLDPGAAIEGGLVYAASVLPLTSVPRLRIDPPDAARQLIGPDGTSSFAVESEPGPAQRARLATPGFWKAFEGRLPRFALPVADAVAETGFYRAENRLSGDWSGVVVTRGETSLQPGFRLRGLLIHLGPGALLLEGAQVNGGVWLAEATTGQPTGNHLRLDAASRIVWDPEVLEQALAQLPVDIVGWRLVFPGE